MRDASSRFATAEEVRSPEFAAVNEVLDRISVSFELPDHSDVNELRYPWSRGMLSKPSFYAARMWEYPYAILAAELSPGLKVADVGCGMTAFTIYLKEQAGCDVTGIDPDVFEAGLRYKGHGVSEEFIKRTGIKFLRGDMTEVPLESDSQDRAFSISVMEHVPPDVRRRGMQELARILKPGGRAILTVDMSMWFAMNRPLELVYESGLNFYGLVDLRWPTRRFGMFSDDPVKGMPADVFGMVLLKDGGEVETFYRRGEEPVDAIPPYRVPTLIPQSDSGPQPLWRRIGGRIKRDLGGTR
ncbi:MAG TPA: class I SAM-dependent methyltransferase [Pyrinomonadaceae bacterium]|jgi:SAM-dependent methyltransferase|nr:class I SAM-dependent methyltransferase [Pyrinomonadaceae bacterium]